jgi:hypothetical protein
MATAQAARDQELRRVLAAIRVNLEAAERLVLVDEAVR